MGRLRRVLLASAVVVAACFPASLPAQAPSGPLTTLTVGGGPDPEYNQVAIESNVRYVDSLLPAVSPRRTLFADGKATTADVLYRDETPAKSPGEAAFRALFGSGNTERFRPPRLPHLDGPATRASLHAEIERLAAAPGKGGYLLYFTGHGSPARNNDLNNNTFGLWNDNDLSVRDLAGEIKSLPTNRPVVLVMVQCFGGAFGNLLFTGGNPESGKLLDRPLCGFFATTRERVAAGCTSEVNEAEYHDFTGAFFAALSGRDRLGRLVKATDYNQNGVIGMDEAWAYAVLTEPSVDVPVTTSDVFLRQFVVINDDEVTQVPYSKIVQMASPLQRGLLDGLSAALNVSGDDRLKVALADVRNRGGRGRRGGTTKTNEEQGAEFLLAGYREKLRNQFSGLKKSKSDQYSSAREEAIGSLESMPTATREAILKAAVTAQGPSERAYADELRGAKFLRLMRVAKTVVLEKRLRDGGDTALIERFDRLRALEAANPLR